MTAKKVIGKMHLVLGFGSGLIVFIIAITGCLHAFKAEIEDLIQSYRFVEPRQQEYLPPSQLQAIAEEVLPDKHVHAVLYADSARAAQVIFYSYDPSYYYFVYVNQYTGEVLHIHDENNSFFGQVLRGHFYLWLPHEIGQPLVASATLVFVVMLASGIYLWWPRNKKGKRQRFTIKWNARWRRKNYDLHNVLGFYVSWVAVILAFTGLVWGFEWFANGYYGLLSGGKEYLPYQEPPSDTTQTASNSSSPEIMDQIWHRMVKEHPDAAIIEVHQAMGPASSILVTINPEQDTYWQMDYRYFDQYSLEELPVDHIWNRYHQATLADKVLRMNYDVHTGGILGLPGKILAFLASLLCASLPVSGFIIWWGRRKKKEKPLSRLRSEQQKKKVLQEA